MADDLTSKVVAEFVGTFFLLFAGVGSIVLAVHMQAWPPVGQHFSSLLLVAFAHGVALSVAVTAAMNISGGHINPAVSIAALATGKIDGKTCGAYIVAQLLAGVVAVGILMVAMPSAAIDGANFGATLVDTSAMSTLGAIVLEAVLTFMLVFAIWGTAISRHAPKIGGFGIGLTVFFDILIGGPLTGASMNPARSFAPNLFAWQMGVTEALTQLPIYWLGPIIGGLVAAMVYEYGIEERFPAEA